MPTILDTLAIQTCVVSYGKEASFAGSLANVAIQVTAKALGVPQLRLVWAATGDIFSSFTDSTVGGNGTPGIIVLPQTGQTGFRHGTSTFKDWYYEAAVTATTSDGQQLSRTYRFQIPAGTTTLDLDTLDEDGIVTAMPAIAPIASEPAGLSAVTQASLSATYVSRDGLPVIAADAYLTSADQTSLLQHTGQTPFGRVVAPAPTQIVVSPDETKQEIWGFGAALTDSAAVNLMRMTPAARQTLLEELFGPNGRRWSMVRIGVGITDFSQVPGNSIENGWTYDDQPAGVTDPNLVGFGITHDNQAVIPILKQILAINPRVRIIASVWSPPVWMKAVPYLYGPTAGTAAGTTLNTAYLNTLGDYLVAYVKAMAAHGIRISLLSPQNEPWSTTGSWTYYSDTDYASLLSTLQNRLRNAGLDYRIVMAHDHHTAYASRAQTYLASTGGQQTENVGWHGYGGWVTNVEQTWALYPRTVHHMTEYRTMAAYNWADSIRYIAGATVIAGLRNRFSSITLWNLALDENGAPYTQATGRRGAVTINSTDATQITRSPDYWALAHMSSFLLPGAKVCACTSPGYVLDPTAPQYDGPGVQAVAAVNPDGSIVLMAYNPGTAAAPVQVVDGRTQLGFQATIPAGAMVTYVWTGTRQASTAAALTPTVPAAPTLTGTAAPGEAHLSWTATADATGYVIGRDGTDLLTVDGTTVAYVVFDATSHSYSVRATGAWGTTAVSNTQLVSPTAATAPTAPTATVTAAPSAATITWTPAADNGSKITSYVVKRSTTSGSGYTTKATLPRGSSSYVDTSVTPGTTFYYTVTATNTIGSGVSAEQSVVVPGASPALLSTSGANTTANALTLDYVHPAAPAGTRTILIVDIGVNVSGTFNPPASTFMTCNGAAMTLLKAPTITGSRMTLRYYVLTPPTGDLTIHIQPSGAYSGPITATSHIWQYVDQTTPFGATGLASNSTGAPTGATATNTTAGSIVLAATYTRAAITGRSGTNPVTLIGVTHDASTSAHGEVTYQAAAAGAPTTATWTTAASDLWSIELDELRYG